MRRAHRRLQACCADVVSEIAKYQEWFRGGRQFIRVRKREYCRSLVYSWMFVAVAFASKNGIRRLIFRFWENSFHHFLASSLHILCISCKFLASSLQVICKFLAKFLAKSLQEFSAGGGKHGKVGPQMVPTSIQNGANLIQGVGKGYPKTNTNSKK